MAAPSNLSVEEIDALTNLTRLLEERNAVIADQKGEIAALRKELLDERLKVAAAIGTLKGAAELPTMVLTTPPNGAVKNPLADSFVL